MALGRPISLTNNVASKIIRVLATDNQTVFTVIGGYRINQLGVFRNGVRLSNNSDFTAEDGVTVTLVNAAQLDDEVLFQIQDDFRVADAIVSAASTQTINGNLTVTGNFNYQGSGVGILTAGSDGSQLTGIVTSITAGDNITVSGATGNVTIGLTNDLTISGNLSVGGTVTYEDVTNVDSVGLITARSGVKVPDAQKILLGTNDDLEIYHSGSHSFIVDSGTGDLYIRASAGYVQDVANANQSWLQFNSGAGVEAHFAGNKKLETTTNGVTVTGSVTATSFTGSGSQLTGLEQRSWLFS